MEESKAGETGDVKYITCKNIEGKPEKGGDFKFKKAIRTPVERQTNDLRDMIVFEAVSDTDENGLAMTNRLLGAKNPQVLWPDFKPAGADGIARTGTRIARQVLCEGAGTVKFYHPAT
jgi:hypothetical protein